MIRYALGVEMHVQQVNVAVIDLESNFIVPGTNIHTSASSQETAENLLNCWTSTIEKSLKNFPGRMDHIGVAIPGPFDYANGISLMKGMGKFDALYQLNIKDMLCSRLGISPANIQTANTAPCFLLGEVLNGAGQGYQNILAFILNSGLGSARYVNGTALDADLWKVPLKKGIANDYLDVKWASERYHEFTGMMVTDIRELTELAKTDDGIGQLVFGEYGENFAVFLAEYIKLFKPDLVLIGGHNDAWELFIPHVKDRLHDKRLDVPIKSAVLGDTASLIGAANLWNPVAVLA